MFGLGYRPVTWQRVRLGAAQDGSLAAIIHDAVAGTSRFEDYTEKTVQSSGMLYQCDNASFDYKLVPLDLCTPSICAPAPPPVSCARVRDGRRAVTLRIDPLELGSRTTLRQSGMGVPFEQSPA
jgi:xanthine dehydrogenase YagR molybdenum-binding subunit